MILHYIYWTLALLLTRFLTQSIDFDWHTDCLLDGIEFLRKNYAKNEKMKKWKNEKNEKMKKCRKMNYKSINRQSQSKQIIKSPKNVIFPRRGVWIWIGNRLVTGSWEKHIFSLHFFKNVWVLDVEWHWV